MFCTKCGKQINEGEVCSCQQPVVPVVVPEVVVPEVVAPVVAPEVVVPQAGIPESSSYSYAAAPNTTAAPNATAANPNMQREKAKEDTTKYLKNAFGDFKGIVSKPCTNGRAFVKEENFFTALGFLGMQAVAAAIFVLVMMMKINSTIKKSFAGFLGIFGSESEDIFQMPVIKDFFLTIIISVLFSALLIGLIFAASMIFKNALNIKATVALVATGSAAICPINLIAFVVCIISVPLGIAVFFIGKLLGLLFILAALPVETENHKNTRTYLMFAAITVFLIITIYLTGKLFPMFLPKDGLNQMKGLFQMFI